MKKSLILLLTLIMMISLVIISCNPDSSSEQAAVKEETFTEDNYANIEKKNYEVISSLGNPFSQFDMTKAPTKVSGTVSMTSTTDKDGNTVGFSLVSKEDLNPTAEGGTGGGGTTTEVEPNVYDYVGVAVEYTVSGKKATVTFEYHLLKQAEDTTGTGTNNNGQGGGTETEDNNNTEIEWSALKTSNDQFAKEVLLLISKSVNKTDGSDVDISELSFDEYLALVIGVGNATPEMTVSVRVEQDGTSATVAIENVKIGGDISKKAVTLGGKISLTSGEGDDKTNIISLGGNVSVTFSNDFEVTKVENSEENRIAPIKGSVNFAVSDIELICGDNAIVVNGSISNGYFDREGMKADCAFSEKVGNDISLATKFKVNSDLGDSFVSCLDFENFVYNGVVYSNDSVKAVLTKVETDYFESMKNQYPSQPSN